MCKTVLICEDEPLARETLRDFIAAWPELQLVGEAHDGEQALALIDTLAPQIVFMDIQMPLLTGLEVLRRVQKMPATIFTTAYDQHAVTAFELNAVDYLLKPFSQDRFDVAVRRLLDDVAQATQAAQAAQATHAPKADPAARADPAGQTQLDALASLVGANPGAAGLQRLSRILVRDRGRIFPLDLAQIEYLKSDTKYTLIASAGKSYLVRVALSELEARLPPERFLRIHRSAIINLDFVVSMKPDEQSQLDIEMTDGSVLTANREASRQLRDVSI
jgi:two-component system, LytTR family, response regulator